MIQVDILDWPMKNWSVEEYETICLRSCLADWNILQLKRVEPVHEVESFRLRWWQELGPSPSPPHTVLMKTYLVFLHL